MGKAATYDEAMAMYGKMVEERADIFGGSYCGYDMCYGGRMVVHDNGTNKSYVIPREETADATIDRIQRSIEAGRNLFYEEWPSKERRRNVLY